MSVRHVFSESEKLCLLRLIIKYKLNYTSTGSIAAKKEAWGRLVEEYNSIKSNSKRTEPQLKKCWDNLKTRRKAHLALEKRKRMKTNQESVFVKTEPCDSADETLTEQSHLELPIEMDSDNFHLGTNEGEETKNIKEKCIYEEFQWRKNQNARIQEREEEIHQLMVAEKQWLVKAAEEKYKRALLERCHMEKIIENKEIEPYFFNDPTA